MQTAAANTNDTAELVVHYLDDEYQKIVKPNRAFYVSNYFIEYWLHRMGATFGWIVVSLQQAAWRAHSDHCTISQSLIADEIGIHRQTVAKELTENPWRAWHIPEMEYQKGIIDKNGVYHPMPNKYGIYDPTPLIPEHLNGLYAYLQATCPEPDRAEIQKAIDHLLGLKAREALALLEQYAQETQQKFETPLSVKSVVEMATGLNIETLPDTKAKELKQQCSKLHDHLTGIGKTICRQFFRLEWIPLLGPALGWLVMIFRSRCFYNPELDELRDTYVWQKKDLVALLGQSNSNLRYLLSHPYAAHFIQILDQQRHKLTVQVALAMEPRPTESAADFWRQPKDSQNFDITLSKDSQNFDITPSKDSQNFDITLSKDSQNFDITDPRTRKTSTSLPKDSQNFDSYKYSKESVLIVVEKDTDSIQAANHEKTDQPKEERRQVLRAAGLTGQGLEKLLNQSPPIDLVRMRAVILYAQARNLGPGYIYRCLEGETHIDDLFMQFAALDEATLTLFRQTVEELTHDGTLTPKIRTQIPVQWVDLFIQFAKVFADLDPDKVDVALENAQLEHARIEPVQQAEGLLAPDVTSVQPEQARIEPVQPKSIDLNDLDAFWQHVLGQLTLQMTRATFDTWIKDTRLLNREGTNFTIATKNAFAKDWLENRLYSTFQRTVEHLTKAEVMLKFVVDTVDNQSPGSSTP